MSLPYFREAGWDPVILTVDPDAVEGLRDPLLEETVPKDVRVVRTGALPASRTRRLGLGNLGLRSLPYLKRAGDQLLTSERFDLVYFSTTVFMTMTLGPGWLRRFKVPYVLDFQDPWLNDYYDRPGAPSPPGGRLKYGLSTALARVFEPRVVRRMSHAVCVSPAYPLLLLDRYPELREDQFTVLPFGAPVRDFELLPRLRLTQRVFDAADGRRHWVYVGAAGPIMRFALRSLFQAVKRERDREPARWNGVMLHFVGTSYAPRGQAEKSVEPVAAEFGVADLVAEHPERLPYFEALQVMAESDAVFLVGSDSAGYTASKAYPCVLARKPLLGIFREESSVVGVIRNCNAGRVVTFGAGDDPAGVSLLVAEQLRWLLSLPQDYRPETDWSSFAPHTALEMTRRQAAVFEHCVARGA